MKDSIRRMRPMGIADILDETVELYKTSFVLLVGIAAVLYVPYSIFNQYLMWRYYPRLDASSKPMDMLPFIGAAVVGMLWVMVVSPFVTGAMTYAISERYLSRGTTVFASFRRVLNLPVLWRIILAVAVSFAVVMFIMAVIGALVAVCVMAGYANANLLFAAIPVSLLLALGVTVGGCYLGLRFVLINCIIVVELKGIVESYKRAWNLMSANMLKALALLALSTVVVGIISSMVVQPTQSIITMSIAKGGRPSEWLLILHTLIGAVSSTLLAPITSIITILLYYDIRIRKEGFDLELLASELHAKSQQAPVWAGQPLPQEQVAPQLPQEQIPPEEGPSPQ